MSNVQLIAHNHAMPMYIVIHANDMMSNNRFWRQLPNLTGYKILVISHQHFFSTFAVFFSPTKS